jgi:hypothetical protein
VKGDIETPEYVVPLTPTGALTSTGAPVYTAAATQSDLYGGSSTINAANANQNTGAATAGSTASISANGKATASVEVTANSLSQPIFAQGSLDGNTWYNLGPLSFLNQNTGAWTASIPAGATGEWTVGVADFPYFRLSTGTTALTGAATVLLNASATQAIVSSEPMRYNAATNTANALVKTGAGILHAVDVAATAAAAVAGLLTIYDNTAASGTILYQEYITTSVLAHSAILDVAFSTGLYVSVAATSVSISTPYL